VTDETDAAPLPQHADPRLIQALDELARWLPPDLDRDDGTVVIPAQGGTRDAFDALVRGVEATLGRSPRWPLLSCISEMVRMLRAALERTSDPIKIDVTYGYQIRVLIRSAHMQEGRRRDVWHLPRLDHDLWAALASRSEPERALVISLLASAANPQYLDPVPKLIEAVRVGRGAADPVSWGFLKEHPEDRVSQAGVAVATEIFMGRRELPWSNVQLADALSCLICSDSSDRRDAAYWLRDLIRDRVTHAHTSELTRWPLLRCMEFCVGTIDEHHQVVLLRHQDVGTDRGPSPLPSANPAFLTPPGALFGTDAIRRRQKRAIDTWFASARNELGATALDAVFVLPLGNGQRQRGAPAELTVDEVRALDHQVVMNVSVHAGALGVGRLVSPRPSWKRLRVSGGQVFLDGVAHRLDGAYTAAFLQKLIEAKGDAVKGTYLATVIGYRPDRIFPLLPTEVQELVDRPPRGRSGWRLK
jgi:hypothetical protein